MRNDPGEAAIRAYLFQVHSVVRPDRIGLAELEELLR